MLNVAIDDIQNGNGHWKKLGNYADDGIDFNLSIALTALSTGSKIKAFISNGDCTGSDYKRVNVLRIKNEVIAWSV